MTRPRLPFLVVVFLAGAAFADPTSVTLFPPVSARFVVGQRFDIRVEGKGTGPFSAVLKVDGATKAFTGATDPTTTDGITTTGWGGFNLRGFSFTTPGDHTLSATFTDSTGTVTIAERTLKVIDVSGPNKKLKNIIIFVGDGMGAAHRTAGRLVRYGATEGDPNGYLNLEKFPGTGMIATHSLNSVITDSAPGMSGYVSGNHNFNGQEGVWPAHVTNVFYGPRIEYLSEFLHRTQGASLGLVSTADLEDATPAANAVHTLNRGAGTGIVDQYFDEADPTNTRMYGTGLSVLLGGGRRWFLPKDAADAGVPMNPFSSRASDDYDKLPDDLVAGWNLPPKAKGALDPARDLISEFKSAGFAYAEDKAALDTALAGNPNKLLGLFAFGNMNVALDKIAKRRNQPIGGSTTFVVDDYHAPNQPMLNEMTQAALNVLKKNDKGFVLMVEGAHIDKQSHLMDADRAVGEVLELDDAVKVARDFADANGDTVIIVTADHECSGFSIIGGLGGGIAALKALPSDRGNVELDPTKSLADQTTLAPKRQLAVGTYDSAGFPKYTINADGYPETFDVDGKLLFGFGANGDRYEGWLTKPLTVVDSLLPSGIKTELAAKQYTSAPYARAESATGFWVRGQVPGDQAVHTASDIPISAYSKGTDAWRQFVGVQGNTDVFFKLTRAVLGGYVDTTPGSGGGTGGGGGGATGGGSGSTGGCSSVGDAPMLLTLLGFLSLVRRRRAARS